MVNFEWVDFYKELASNLLSYKDKRRELIDKVKQVYDNIGINLPTLERDNNIIDIDPFTFFGLFNKSSLKESNRIKIVTEIAKLFGIKAKAPVSYFSLPTLNNQNATFYYFIGDRAENDIDDLWELFESALTYSKDASAENRGAVSKWFDIVINKKGNGNSKITMGLYWIAPETFLNLDQRSEWYIYDSGKVPKEIIAELPVIKTNKIPAKDYFILIEKLRTYLQSPASEHKNFRELSYAAWSYSEEVNQQKKIEAQSNGSSGEVVGSMPDESVRGVHYWIFAPGNNAYKWEEFYSNGIMGLGWEELGDLRQYATKEEMRQKMLEVFGDNTSMKNSVLATWQFSREMQPGDVVFAKRGQYEIVGRGVVTSDYEYDEERDEYNSIRRVNWTHKGSWKVENKIVLKTLTDITQYSDYVATLSAMFEEEEEVEGERIIEKLKEYTSANFLDEVYISADEYKRIVGILKNKLNIILQGAPGVGKTFMAKRLAYSIMGVMDPDRVMMVQFHQSYSYEDFIMGYRPSGKGFEPKYGAFYDFCKRAADDSDRDYFFIIDEINRGNISKIFGELFMLIEKDKRNYPLRLLYSDEKFSVPQNLHIIGLMNTADRSLAMLDYALRRRFAFIELRPAFASEGFLKYKGELNNEKFNRLVDCVISMNNTIESDETLGEGFCIGHSYFCGLDAKTIDYQTLEQIVEYELIPLIKEYWFDEPSKVRDWSGNLRSAIK